MDDDAILGQAIALLQLEWRLSSRVRKLRLPLDDGTLEAPKEDLIDAKPLAPDADGSVLVWMGAAAAARTWSAWPPRWGCALSACAARRPRTSPDAAPGTATPTPRPGRIH